MGGSIEDNQNQVNKQPRINYGQYFFAAIGDEKDTLIQMHI